MALSMQCMCEKAIEAEDMQSLGDEFIAHVRSEHPDLPYPDVAVRNFAEATQRLSTDLERRESIGPVSVHHVDQSRVDDFLGFMDRDAFAGKPEWAACYCTEPHLASFAEKPEEVPPRTWQHNRELMSDMLRSGRSYGYLAYVDGAPAGWVNASMRKDYTLYRVDNPQTPDADTIGVSCFVIAPAYRRHGLAGALLDAVLADAAGRGAKWVEAYPAAEDRPDDAGNFHGPLSMFLAKGFEEVNQVAHLKVVRKPV